MDRLYTAAEVAEKLNIPVVTIWDWQRKRWLGCVKIGRNVRFTQAQIDEFLTSRTQEGLEISTKN